MPFSPMRLLSSTPGNSAVRFGTRSFAPLSYMIGLPCFRDAFFLDPCSCLEGIIAYPFLLVKPPIRKTAENEMENSCKAPKSPQAGAFNPLPVRGTMVTDSVPSRSRTPFSPATATAAVGSTYSPWCANSRCAKMISSSLTDKTVPPVSRTAFKIAFQRTGRRMRIPSAIVLPGETSGRLRRFS